MKTASAIPILMYHHVSPSPGLVTISPDNFRSQIQWLATNGWRSVGTTDLENFLNGIPLPKKSLMLSFDDGWLDNWLFAYPILKEFGFKAVLFLVTGWVGDGPIRHHTEYDRSVFPAHNICMEKINQGQFDAIALRWSEIEYMKNTGVFEFHSHTHTHARWDLVEPNLAQRYLKLAADLEASRRTLVTHLGDASPHLCWPQGYFDDSYLKAAKELGFTHCYTTSHNTVTKDAEPTKLPRIVVKDKPANWLSNRLSIYSRPRLARFYNSIKAAGLNSK